MVPQRRLPQVGSLGHGETEHRAGRVQPRQRRAVGVGDVRQLRGPEHADRSAGLQGARVRQAHRPGGHQSDGGERRLSARAHQREEQRVAGPVQERRLRQTLDTVTVRCGRRPGYIWPINRALCPGIHLTDWIEQKYLC